MKDHKYRISEDTEVHRASGLYICEVCGKQYYDHPKFAYPNGQGEVIEGCDGRYYHL